MADYAALKTRIISETNRDDLADTDAVLLDQHVAMAVDEFANEAFWFNTAFSTVTTVAGTATVAVPAALRVVTRVSGDYGDLRQSLADYLILDTTAGYPERFAYVGGTLRFSPVPAGAHVLTIFGVLQVDAPADDADDTIWTNEAARLIAAQTRYTLMRDKYRDIEAASLAKAAVDDALRAARRETNRRFAGGALLGFTMGNGVKLMPV